MTQAKNSDAERAAISEGRDAFKSGEGHAKVDSFYTQYSRLWNKWLNGYWSEYYKALDALPPEIAQAGRDAFDAGQPSTSNPYDSILPEWQAWANGWQFREWEKEDHARGVKGGLT